MTSPRPDDLIDGILPAQAVYAAAVIAAEHAYRDAVNQAWQVRKKAIDSALATCLIALGHAKGPESG